MKLIGFCGLPNSGKSTFFKLLSKVDIEIANYPFTTLKPKEAVVPIFSKELEELHQITKTKQVIPGFLKFLDVPGLIRGAHKGEGLGNEFLSYLRQCDAILEITRTFENENVPSLVVIHSENGSHQVDPERDILIIEEEIIESEKNIIKNNLSKLNRATTKEEKLKRELLETILSGIEPFKRFPEYANDLKEYNLLITKNWYLIFNGDKPKINIENIFVKDYTLDFKWELELSTLTESTDDDEFKIQTYKFLEKFRKDLGLIQFFTFTNDITQSWFAGQGSTAFNCAGLIHTDFQNKFYSAEIINLTEFKNINEWKIAKERGFVKTAGKEHIIQENDILKIAV